MAYRIIGLLIIASTLLLMQILAAKYNYQEGDLCVTKPFNYTVRLPGCSPEVIQNNFCYGLCRSLFYPKKRRFGLKATSVCSFCAPISIKMKLVRLNCHNIDSGTKRYKFKLVKVFESCKCKRSKCEAWPIYYL